MNMRNATCVGTQTSKLPTRVTLLFIPYTWEIRRQNQGKIEKMIERTRSVGKFIENGR